MGFLKYFKYFSFSFFFCCVTNEPQRPLSLHWEPELWVEATQYNTDHELLIVVSFPWWVTAGELSRDIIHMPKSIWTYPCWGLYLWQTRQKTSSLAPLPVLVPGVRAERQGQCGFSFLLPPAAQAHSQLEGPCADHQGRACWCDKSPPGKAMLLETAHQALACTSWWFSCQQSYIIPTNNVARLTKHYLKQRFSWLSFLWGGAMIFSPQPACLHQKHAALQTKPYCYCKRQPT